MMVHGIRRVEYFQSAARLSVFCLFLFVFRCANRHQRILAPSRPATHTPVPSNPAVEPLVVSFLKLNSLTIRFFCGLSDLVWIRSICTG